MCSCDLCKAILVTAILIAVSQNILLQKTGTLSVRTTVYLLKINQGKRGKFVYRTKQQLVVIRNRFAAVRYTNKLVSALTI